MTRYGVDNPTRSSEVTKRREATNIERYGHINPFANEAVKQKIKQTTFQNFGVEHIAQSEHYKQAFIQTVTEKYGSVAAFNQHLLAKRTKTNLERYGVENPLQRPDVLARQMKTMIDKGIRRYRSKLEERIETLLRQAFEIVHVQKWVNGSPIDFYVPSVNAYVQVDGEFYHGLTERALEYDFVRRNYERDRQQDKWFKENNLKLVRLAEKTVCDISVEDLRKIIVDAV